VGPNLVLGTMTFGQQVFIDEATEIVRYFIDQGYNELDTAYVYNEGECEKTLGKIITNFGRERFKIATKVNPRISGKLDGDAVIKQLPESLKRMDIERADILYLHFPDPNTPVESALEACDKAYRSGQFVELGLSNFPAWMVADVYNKCKAHGWVLPTVYEGVYNALSRNAEKELFDALKAFNMRFYAYNPLAGGMLTGKYSSFDDKPQDGRFALRKTYLGRYWKKSFFDAVVIIREACAVHNMPMAEAALRWLAYHSKLRNTRGDAIIIGASRLSQLDQNISAVEKGALPDDVVDAFKKAWSVSKAESPEYFTYYKG
jgi:aflatoxin B1 aldehyde reductase